MTNTASSTITHWTPLEAAEWGPELYSNREAALIYIREWISDNPRINPIISEDGSTQDIKFSALCMLDEELLKIQDEKNKIKFIKIAEVFKRVYTNPDLIDIKIEESLSKIVVCCHFPEIHITNSKKVRHKIVDLYVIYTVFLKKSGGLQIEIEGFRHKVTKQEAHRNYYHSHLSGNKRHFCLGSGEVTELKASLLLEYDEDVLELLLETFNSALHWESLEGTPYNYIGHLGNSSYSAPIYMPNSADEFLLFKFISKTIEDSKDSFLPLVRPASEDEPVRIDDRLLENFKLFIKDKIIESVAESHIDEDTVKKLLFNIDYHFDGIPYYKGLNLGIPSRDELRIDTNVSINFKGETLIPHIIPDPLETKNLLDYLEDDSSITIYTPYLLNYFILFLNYAIYKNTN